MNISISINIYIYVYIIYIPERAEQVSLRAIHCLGVP